MSMGFYDNMKVSRPTLMLVSSMLESSNEPYYQLHVMLSFLRYLYLLHQTNHWTASGDPYYGDHLLFERLYNTTVEEIDAIGEKAVGLGSPRLVNLKDQLNLVTCIQESNHRHYIIPRPDELVDSSLVAEATFLCSMKMICDSLKSNGLMTHGLDNLLAGVEDKHEGSLYLLKQRAQSVFMV
jgi:DNA-binding ferritin-like protein